jgi:phage anti-repressor protein
MITLLENGRVDARTLWYELEIKTRFNDWVDRVVERTGFIEGIEYYSKLSSIKKVGKPQINYEFTLDAAKEACIVSDSPKSKQLRQWLIQLSNKVESGSLVSHKQVLEIVKMIKIFSIYEYRKMALSKNAENYVSKALINNPEYSKNKGMLYGKFNNWRNEVLQTGKDYLAQRVKEYCLIERKRIPAKFTQDEALTLMGEYEQIKNAIWDLLSSQNKSEEMINNICSLAHELAKEMKPFLERLNESNLFFNKIDESEIRQITQ